MDKFKNFLLKASKLVLHIAKVIYRFLLIKSKQSPYFTKSLILHFFIIVIVSGLIPTCSSKIEEPKIIAVSIVPMQAKEAPKPKVKPKIVQKKKPEPKKEVKKKEVKKKPVETKKKEEVEVKKKSKIPSLKKEEIMKKPKKEEKEKEDKDKKQEAEKEQEGKKSLLKDLEKKESIDEIIEKVEKEDKKKEEKEIQQIKEKKLDKEAEFVPDAKFVKEIMGIVQGQISQCWSIPIGAKDVHDMQVKLYIRLDPNGNIRTVRIIDRSKYDSDKYFRVLADSAVWAVKECSPLQGLPEDKHKYWEEIEFTFNPSSVL